MKPDVEDWRARLPVAFRASLARGESLGLRKDESGTVIRLAMGTITSGVADEGPLALTEVMRRIAQDGWEPLLEGEASGFLQFLWGPLFRSAWSNNLQFNLARARYDALTVEQREVVAGMLDEGVAFSETIAEYAPQWRGVCPPGYPREPA